MSTGAASSLPPTFLGIELATDQLRAVILDEHQEVVSTCSIDFDADLPEYGTQGGIFVAPGEAWTTPVEMWVRGLGVCSITSVGTSTNQCRPAVCPSRDVPPGPYHPLHLWLCPALTGVVEIYASSGTIVLGPKFAIPLILPSICLFAPPYIHTRRTTEGSNAACA